MAREDAVEHAKYEPLRKAPPSPVSEALESFPYGVYVIGSRSASGELNGMLADWVMQLSFKPRMVGVSFENDATTLNNVRATNVFTVNILPATGGKELAAQFIQPHDASKVKGRSEEESARTYDKLGRVPHTPGDHTQCPVLDQALAYVECRAEQFVPAGDHTLVIGRVLDGDVLGEGEPLTQRILGWSYGG